MDELHWLTTESLTEMLKARGPAGDLFRKVVNQRAEPKHSKQGYYICTPDGNLIKGSSTVGWRASGVPEARAARRGLEERALLGAPPPSPGGENRNEGAPAAQIGAAQRWLKRIPAF